jgi:hypothetical protein
MSNPKQYCVRLSQTIIEEAWVTVTAMDEASAEDAAIQAALEDKDNPVEWRFADSRGDIEAIDIEICSDDQAA